MRDQIIDAYIEEIVFEIYKVEYSKPESERMDNTFLLTWIKEIEESCERMYEHYLIGKREHYQMSVEEYEEIFDEAGLKYSEQILDNLIDGDQIVAEINKHGKILYKKNDSL